MLRPTSSGAPVVACSVHSQVGVVAATIAAVRPGTRVAYVMTDGGALPLALSDLVHSLRAGGLLVGTVTAGHAFGGDREAVSMPSALAIARHALDAEVVVAGMGLGGVGTGSRLGYSGLEQAGIMDATAWLGGRPVACVRASSGDARPRHQGVSHHTTTVLEAVRSPVDVPVPADLELGGPDAPPAGGGRRPRCRGRAGGGRGAGHHHGPRPGGGPAVLPRRRRGRRPRRSPAGGVRRPLVPRGRRWGGIRRATPVDAGRRPRSGRRPRARGRTRPGTAGGSRHRSGPGCRRRRSRSRWSPTRWHRSRSPP